MKITYHSKKEEMQKAIDLLVGDLASGLINILANSQNDQYTRQELFHIVRMLESIQGKLSYRRPTHCNEIIPNAILDAIHSFYEPLNYHWSEDDYITSVSLAHYLSSHADNRTK